MVALGDCTTGSVAVMIIDCALGFESSNFKTFIQQLATSFKLSNFLSIHQLNSTSSQIEKIHDHPWKEIFQVEKGIHVNSQH